MSIDWITVAAQIVNFLVLVWLLKRFLYRPILDGIDAREAEIAARMGEAAAIRQTAEAAEARYRAKAAALHASHADTAEAARRAAEEARAALLAEARASVERERADEARARDREAQRFTQALHRTGAEALLALTRKALADLADETLEHRIVARAAPRLAAIAGDLQAAAGDSREAVVLTRSALDDAAQARLRDDLAAILPGHAIRFETDATLSPGLSLRLGGAQVAWTVDSYLDGLEATLDDLAGQTGQTGQTGQQGQPGAPHVA
jgi:F-type H+-transporting ATPase subunit b